MRDFDEYFALILKTVLLVAIGMALLYGLVTVPSLLMRQNTNDMIYRGDKNTASFISSAKQEIARDWVAYNSTEASPSQKSAIKYSACLTWRDIKDYAKDSPWAKICD